MDGAGDDPGQGSLGIGSLRDHGPVNHLLRSHAPVSELGWAALDREGRDRLVPSLAARKLVDFSGPHGWQHSSIGIGRDRGYRGARPSG